MNGARIVISISGLDRLQERLDKIAGIGFDDVLETVGEVVESQVRRRITSEQEAPDGTPWEAWSKAYARTRHGNHSLLISGGALVDSLGFVVTRNMVEVGSNMIYAGVHQFGNEAKGIPARPYLGLSDDDEREITAVIDGWIEELLA